MLSILNHNPYSLTRPPENRFTTVTPSMLFDTCKQSVQNNANRANTATKPRNTSHGVSALAELSLGNSFCTSAVWLASTVKQLAVPQSYPLGQHPATGPAVVPHKNQPSAQVELAVVVGTSVARTTMVWPSETMVVDGAGQEYVLQSRSVRQQPPP